MTENFGLMFTPSTADFSKLPELLKSMKLVEEETGKLTLKMWEFVENWMEESDLPSGQTREVLLLSMARTIELYKKGQDNRKNGDRLQI
jgi:hypothetical protein